MDARIRVLTSGFRRFVRAMLAVILLSAAGDHATAQPAFPRGLVRIVTGAGPGTPPDAVARILAEALSRRWGQPVIVESVVGVGGNTAGARVAAAEPDGHTLLMAANAGIVINPSMYKNMPYDPAKDLRPISVVYSYPSILVVHKDVAARTLQDLIALAKARPGQLTFASAGPGSSQHIAAEMMKAMTGIDIVHVPYRGGLNLSTDLIAGRVDMFFGIPTNVLPQLREGQVRALAVSSTTRLASMPDLPTMAEAGLPGYDMTVWWGLLAPSRTPADVVEGLHQDIKAVLAQPEMRRRLEAVSVEPVGNSPEEFSRLIQAEIPKWKKIVNDAAIALD